MIFRIVERGGRYRIQYKNRFSPFWHTFKDPHDTPLEYSNFEHAKSEMFAEIRFRQNQKKKWQEIYTYKE